LLLDHVVDHVTNILIIPQPSRASMTCPSLLTSFLAPESVQSSAGIGLEIIHHLLRPYLRFYKYMHMTAPHMRR